MFEYKGLNKKGSNVKGTIDAENVRAAKTRLKKQGVYVQALKDRSKGNKGKKNKKVNASRKVNVKDLAMMTRQLATLLKANIPLVDSLAAVSEQVENESLAETMAEIKNMVNEGQPLYKSMAKYPKTFDIIFLSMTEAGEMSGTLDTILIRLAEFTESANELQSKVKSAMIYPLIMIVVTIAILGVVFTYVVPKMVEIFEASEDLILPWFTLLIIDLSDIVIEYWPVIIIATFVLFFIFRNWKNSPNGRKTWDKIVLKIPVMGKLLRLVAVSRFAQTLSTLLNGGVPMLAAMDIVRNVVNNDVLAVAIDDARENISEGESIAGPLKRSGQFPPMVIHMISIGEKTGELESMLEQVSKAYDFQVNTEVDGLTALMEPVMIVVMGGVIGSIVVAIMVPLFDMMNMGT